MKTFQTIILTALAAFSLFSCKKDKGPDKTELLTTGNWRLIAHNVTTISTGAMYDNYTSSPACSKDNEFTFTAAGVHEYSEGATKCNPADPQVIYFAAWRFINNQTAIEVSAGSQVLEYKILSLSSTELSMEVSTATVIDRVKFIH